MTEPAAGDGSVVPHGSVSPSPTPATEPVSPAPAGRRRVRRRVARPPWVRLWNYLSAGPPAEIAQSLVEMWRPAETFSNRRGPWHRGLVVARERRYRKRQSPVVRYARYGAPAEVARLVVGRVRRHPIAWALSLAAVIWWFWPWMRPPVPPVISAQDNRPFVVGVDGTTFRRIRAALSAWRAMPGARLVVMDLGALQSYTELRNAAFTPEELKRVSVIRTCGDTVTLAADMAKFLRKMPGAPGQLLVVTSPDHLERLTALMQVMLGGAGWRLESLPSAIAENPPESILRRWRDELRAQFWRATGVSGKNLFVCRARDRGLI